MKGALFVRGLAVVSALLLALPALAYTSPGNPTGYVNDFAHVLNPDTVQNLNAQLTEFEKSTSNEISIVTVPNMGGDYIEHYASELFKEWGIGKKDRDNGVLLLLSIEERKIRIEVGYGLEGALPDSIAARIIANDITPKLKAGDYDEAVTSAAASIEAATKGEYRGGEEFSSEDAKAVAEHTLGVMFAIILVLQWLAAVLGRSKSWWAGGIVGALMGLGIWFFFGLLLLGGISTFVGLTMAGLLFDYVVSKTYKKATKGVGSVIPWWIGGGRSGGSSGGGFGGFGGGRSGGGGASGGW